MKVVSAAFLGLSLIATPILAKPPLRDVPAIDDALFDLGVADIIRKKCSTIDARMLRAIGYVRKLERRAKALGYTEEEIEAYTDSERDKNRLRAKAASYFAARGVDPEKPESYCAVGREEIHKASRIGSLLRAK